MADVSRTGSGAAADVGIGGDQRAAVSAAEGEGRGVAADGQPVVLAHVSSDVSGGVADAIVTPAVAAAAEAATVPARSMGDAVVASAPAAEEGEGEQEEKEEGSTVVGAQEPVSVAVDGDDTAVPPTAVEEEKEEEEEDPVVVDGGDGVPVGGQNNRFRQLSVRQRQRCAALPKAVTAMNVPEVLVVVEGVKAYLICSAGIPTLVEGFTSPTDCPQWSRMSIGSQCRRYPSTACCCCCFRVREEPLHHHDVEATIF